MRYFIKKITIEGFRGVNNENNPLELNFKPDHINSVFASNAQGKSSIFDALSYAIKGHIPRLTQLQRAEKAEDYYNNQFHSTKTATIGLLFEASDGSPDVSIEIKRQADGMKTISSPSGNPNPQTFLERLSSEFCLLDYKTFLHF